MADNILDIVHRISYEVTGQNQIQAITARFNENVQSIGRNVASLARLQQQLNATTDPARQARLQQAIQNRTRAINEQGQAINTAIQNDRQFQRTLQSEIGIINELNGRLTSLRDSRNRATSQSEVRRYTDQINAVEREQRRLMSGGSALGGLGNSLLQGIGIGSGIQIFDSVIGKMGQLITEASRLAAELEGVRPAFDRLNDPELLANLQAATKGTVSDLELMKQAVMFNNFGLPIERMADALKFARIRARETGQDVNYLVNSIVIGIGRQSPLILDNLGINVKRVRDEFSKTGDFAQAAFKIISEEAGKSSQDLDTFTESIAKMNAQLENTQAKFGQDFNDIITTFKVLGADAVATLGNLAEAVRKEGQLGISSFDIVTKNSEAFKKLAEDRNRQIELQPRIQEIANTTYLLGYKKFIDEYTKTDQVGRSKIIEQARAMNDSVNSGARQAYEEGTDDLFAYLNGQAGAFQRFLNQIKTIPVNVGLINSSNVKGLTREQLTEAQTANDLLRNALTGNDKEAIKRIADTDKLIKEQLDAINGQVSKPANRIRSPRVTPVDFNKLREEILKNYKKMVIDINDDIRSSDEFIINPSKDGDIIFGAAQTFSDKIGDVPQAKMVAQFELAHDLRKKEEEEKNDQLKKDQEREEARVEASRAAYDAIVQNASLALNSILDAQIRAADREIQYRTGTVEKAKELALRGNTEVLRAEEEQLAKATAARETAAQRQIELNALLQASNMAVALSEAIGAIVAAAAEGDPYTIAARVIAAVAALVGGVAALSSAFSASSQGFKDGVIDLKGPGTTKSDSIPARLSKGESVMTAEATQKYKSHLELMNKGLYPIIPDLVKPKQYQLFMPMVPKSNSNDVASKREMNRLEKKLDEVVGAIQGLEIKADQRMDEYGLTNRVAVIKKQEQQRFSR